jgi:hypothetical protein
MKTKPVPTAAALADALRRRYPRDSYAVLTQVRNATGYKSLVTRYADALVMGLWPSRGLLMEGFEFKVSRADWLVEKRKPFKADEFFSYCDKFWLVISNRSIASVDELPPSWGLLVLHGPNLHVLREAQILQPQPLERSLLAAIMRAAVQNLVPEDALKAEREVGRLQGHAEAEHSHTQAIVAHDALQTEVHAFERVSGLRFGAWDKGVGARIGTAVKAIQDAEGFLKQMHSISQNARWLAERAEEAAKQVAAAHAVLPSDDPPKG